MSDPFAYELPPNVHALPIDTTSEDALALEFINRHPELRYIAERGLWFRWDGARWGPDSTGHTFADIREMLRRAPAATEREIASLRSAKTVAAIERLARYDRRAAMEFAGFDADDWILNTPAGLVDLRTGSVNPHDPLAYCSKITGAAPGGECPRWTAFLADVTAGDEALAGFLQRVVGYGLTGSTAEHALFFLYGTGGNGKGVFLNTIAGVLGDYATTAGMDTFTEAYGDRRPADLAALQGGRVVIAQETEEGRRWAESRIKALTGGDPITARFMRQDFFTFQPKFKLFIAGNHKPRLQNVDEAMRRRLHLIPFTVTIPVRRRDPHLADALAGEWSGILDWAIEGCRLYLAEGLSPPVAVRSATEQYFGAEDVFGQWLEECCDRGPEYSGRLPELFASWKNFADQANERPGKQNTFTERLTTRGFRNVRDSKGRRWRGLRLKPEATADRDGVTPW